MRKTILATFFVVNILLNLYAQDGETFKNDLKVIGVELLEQEQDITPLNYERITSNEALINSYRLYSDEVVLKVKDGPKIKLTSAKSMENQGYVFNEETLNKIRSNQVSNFENQVMVELNIGYNTPKADYPEEKKKQILGNND